MLSYFERLVNPFPSTLITAPPKRLWPFAWACTHGMRRLMLMMSFCTALIGAFEAWLYALMGNLVDWLAKVQPSSLWQQERSYLTLLAAILLGSTLLVALQTFVKHQSLAGNFPMRMRWQFHRLMLNQSLSFYQDEFAGRVSAKVMQTALAVRDVWFIAADIMVYVLVYFGTMIFMSWQFHASMMWPLVIWLACYALVLTFFVPRLSKISQRQADARVPIQPPSPGHLLPVPDNETGVLPTHPGASPDGFFLALLQKH